MHTTRVPQASRPREAIIYGRVSELADKDGKPLYGAERQVDSRSVNDQISELEAWAGREG
ncbi:MAG: hypothetical protein ACRDTE_21430 [Pseudonocardiaceae bacterium]